MSRDALRLEFGRYSEWILEAVEAVGVGDPIAVACRGTGDVGLFEDLAAAIGARPGLRVLDVGCGLGGPGAWLRRTRACDVVGIDLMDESVAAARHLFGAPGLVVASMSELPFRSAAFDAAWTVGVLEMIEDKGSALREAARVLRPNGRMAIYTFTATGGALDDAPATDHFVSAAELSSLADSAGFEVVVARPVVLTGEGDPGWRAARIAVAEEIRRRHAADPAFDLVREELGRFGRLQATGAVAPWRFDLVVRAPAA